MSRKPQKSAAEFNRDHLKREQKKMLLITPPEGVPLLFRRASLGARLGAQLLDLLITYGSLLLLAFLVTYLSWASWFSETTEALFAILAFLVRAPYYILTELVWNGRTIGKRIVKIRVISVNGRRLDPHQVVVRNLMKEAEVFLPIMLVIGVMTSSGWVKLAMAVWLLFVFAVPLFSRQNQRLGDMIAGTCVVEQPKIALAKELTERTHVATEKFVFEPHHLEHYGRFELQSLERILRDPARSQAAYDRDKEVARTIAKKIGFTDRIADMEASEFLSSFYGAQRASLESGQIFGDVREDKLHGKNGKSW
ncbi:RDD family protein [Yoonia sediminilitoris]|uniref:Putative RDD family membrane protein YckC n=1 Tax=Yoonia sediminilitoris TaxID=1286148 RepID=A0A2T6KMP8_9RHOB|nr:RDD family protein [Yoonia sediminilitoris]PUB17488.1 putative RDD family membrane protein YckC [Yoonia sediminilitoris]RCW97783.1 putative RDD family membrane protein YckC [Yoonia sediminilitoris]